MVTAVILAFLGLHPPVTPSVVEDSVYSPILHRTLHYRMLVSTDADPNSTTPALILLHGYGGNHRDWTNLTDIEDEVARMQIAVIMPDGENSWYVNAVNDSAGHYENALLLDLLPAVRHRIRIDTTRMGVAGLSMGGFGALELGLRHPTTFRFIGALSASLDVPFGIPDLERNGRGGLRGSLVTVFGTDTSHWAAHSIPRLAQQIDPRAAPYVYLANGVQDEFTLRLTLYREFAEQLRSRGLRYEYHETPGRHSWDYWGREIHGVLHRFMEVVR